MNKTHDKVKLITISDKYKPASVFSPVVNIFTFAVVASTFLGDPVKMHERCTQSA